MKIKLQYDGGSGDGKRAFFSDEHSELRIEVDTDDVSDKESVIATMKEVVRRCNAANKP